MKILKGKTTRHYTYPNLRLQYKIITIIRLFQKQTFLKHVTIQKSSKMGLKMSWRTVRLFLLKKLNGIDNATRMPMPNKCLHN